MTEPRRVRITDWWDGFFHPASAEVPHEVVDASNFRHSPVAGLPKTVQFFRCNVEGCVCVLVGVDTLSEELLGPTATALGEHLQSCALGLVRAMEHGRAVVESVGSSEEELTAAVAMWLHYGAWDESERVFVTLDGVERVVSLDVDSSGDSACVHAALMLREL